MSVAPRVLDLPARGTLLVATDLQGNLRDFRRLRAIFEETKQADPDARLVITGDLIHGPDIEEQTWPEQLGTYYQDASAEVLREAFDLQACYPDHVTYLLGNHEHAHVGGPVVGKFFPDEAGRLEGILGAERSGEIQTWLASWPLVAVARQARLCLLHAAPRAKVASREQIEALALDVSEDDILEESTSPAGVLGALLWARGTTPERAQAFLRALHPDLTVAVFGHDVAREGYAIDLPACLCLSTSFGCHDGDKFYLSWDLANAARSAHDLVAGLRKLWPEAPAMYSDLASTA